MYGLEKPASLCASSSSDSAAFRLLLCSLLSGLRLTEGSADFTGALTAGRTLDSTLLLPQPAHTDLNQFGNWQLSQVNNIILKHVIIAGL